MVGKRRNYGLTAERSRGGRSRQVSPLWMESDRRDQRRVASSKGDEAVDWAKLMFDKSSEFREEFHPSMFNS